MRIGDSLWHSKRIENDNAEFAEYEKPIELKTRANYLTCMSAMARGGIQVLQYGENANNVWTIIANARNFNGFFKKGDLMWVDGEKPIANVEETYGYGASATALVTDVSKGNQNIIITLERNQKKATE